jgi:hypothetical protein
MASAEASLLAAVEQSKSNLDQTFGTIVQAEIDALAQAMLSVLISAES